MSDENVEVPAEEVEAEVEEVEEEEVQMSVLDALKEVSAILITTYSSYCVYQYISTNQHFPSSLIF
jgi:hypothetical protein